MNARDTVVRQALIEYIVARAPDVFDLDDNPTTAEIHTRLDAYVRRRYSEHPRLFQARTQDRLTGNLHAAFEELRTIRDRPHDEKS